MEEEEAAAIASVVDNLQRELVNHGKFFKAQRCSETVEMTVFAWVAIFMICYRMWPHGLMAIVKSWLVFYPPPQP